MLDDAGRPAGEHLVDGLAVLIQCLDPATLGRGARWQE